MILRRKKVVIISYILIIAVLTGCFNAKELDELGISLAMGIDYEDGKILITAEVVDPAFSSEASNTGEGSSVRYVQGIGNTILEALKDITLKFDRGIYSAHNKVLIFGEEIAKQGLVSHMDELIRDREQRESSYMLIAKGAKAYEVMGINSGIETIPANYILGLIKNVESNPKTVDFSIMDYLKHYYHEGHHPVAGVIEKIQKNEINETGEKSGTKGYELTVIGSALFKKDKLIGYLNGNDTKALNYLLDNVKGGIITFPATSVLEEVQSQESEQILNSVNVIKVKTKNDVELEGDKVILKSKVYVRAALGELLENTDISKEGNLKRIEDDCSKTVELNIKAAVQKVQKEFGIDIFGFGIVFHRKYPKQWKKIKDYWDEIFADAEYQIEVNTHIIRTGLINRPLEK